MGTGKHGHCLPGGNHQCKRVLDNGHECTCEHHENRETSPKEGKSDA